MKKSTLWTIAFHSPSTFVCYKYGISKEDKKTALKDGLAVVKDGHLVLTDEGKARMSPMAVKALGRPKDFFKLEAEAQWAVDKSLGILDWDGE